MMNAGFKRPAAMVTVLSLIGFSLGCQGETIGTDSGELSDYGTGGVTVASEVEAAIDLAVEEVRPQTFKFAVSVAGMVRANQNKTAVVGPIIEGTISEIFVDWGEPVKKGDVLAYLKSVDVGTAKAAYFQARAALRVAVANLERKKRLFDEKIVPEKDLLQAEAERTSVQAEADATEWTLHVIGFTEEEVATFSERHDLTAIMPIIAPISGVIVDRQAVIGAMADPSMELFTIMDLSTLWVDAAVYEKDLAKVRPGQQVEISIIAYPNETFSGRVSYIGNTLDKEKRTAVVRAVLKNGDRKIKPGMFVTVRILTTEKENATVLPEGAVLSKDGISVVVIQDADEYRLREVQMGMVADGRVEILAGLSFGERVVTSGHNQIAAQLLGRTKTDSEIGNKDD
ncbi:MAG: efflux RND transporter periplasmic adaptor subunit [Rhodothermia bacterium]|nr:MAG: efflux RND transporter periplasmic adaptor subunit [Rhodothermia bacterium]